MRRREFITLLGGAAATWPLAARAQQPAMPVIGFLDPSIARRDARSRLRAFRQGLKDTGYVEGENVSIVYRWAEDQIDRLPALAADLVRRQVAVIAATAGDRRHSRPRRQPRPSRSYSSSPKTRSRLALVASLARPGGNLTGVNFLERSWRQSGWNSCVSLCPRLRGLLCFVNPASNPSAEITLRDVRAAPAPSGCKSRSCNASTSREIDAAFASFVRERPDALFVATDRFLNARRVQLAILAMRHALPAII